MEDIVRHHGYLTLGTRLKRISERLQADTQRILDECDLQIPVGQFPFLAAIDRLGPLTIGELAKAVGVTQPGTTRTVVSLIDSELVSVELSSADQRQKTVSLTEQGKRIVAKGKAKAWPRIEGAVREICDDLNGPLLEQLAAIESALDVKPLVRRAAKLQESKK